MRQLHYSEPQLRLEQPSPPQFLNPTEAAANAFVAPFLAAVLLVIGGLLAGLALTILSVGNRGLEALWFVAWGGVGGLILAALRLLGVFDGFNRLLDILLAHRLDVDTDQDGIEDQEETQAALALFTEEGIQAFVREVMYRRKDWRSRALVPRYLTREEYDVVIGDILPTIGLLGEAKRNQPRPLLIKNESEAMRTIEAYFRRSHRRVWSFTIGDKRIVL